MNLKTSRSTYGFRTITEMRVNRCLLKSSIPRFVRKSIKLYCTTYKFCVDTIQVSTPTRINCVSPTVNRHREMYRFNQFFTTFLMWGIRNAVYYLSELGTEPVETVVIGGKFTRFFIRLSWFSYARSWLHIGTVTYSLEVNDWMTTRLFRLFSAAHVFLSQTKFYHADPSCDLACWIWYGNTSVRIWPCIPLGPYVVEDLAW